MTKKPSPDTPAPSDPDVLLPENVAERLGLTTEMVLRSLGDGTIPGKRFDDGWRIYWPAVVDAFGHDPARDVIRPLTVAKRLGLNEQTVRSLLTSGALPGRKLGNQWFIYWPAVIATLGYGEPEDRGSDSGPPERVQGGNSE
uniref:helix-turn-helix domain-containing protein n=1 Tax=Amycolatopsis sp. CA-151526 TaxID=3239921 RepID=UPI003F493998